MSVFSKFKRKITSQKGIEESLEDSRELLSKCDAKIKDLKRELFEANNQNNMLHQSLDSKDVEIDDLRNTVSNLRRELDEQAGALIKAKSAVGELTHSNLNLQEENELLVGRSVNVVSKLVRFCQLLKTMDISSVGECIAIIQSEIEQSTTDLGFEIIDAYEGEFNPEKHCIIDTLVTDDRFLNNHIAKVVRPGIWYHDKCLIPQDVIVYKVNN